MNNSYCRDYVLGLTSEIKMDELSHHGILGMSWGKRFGPPYPLGGVDKTVARAEAKRKKEAERRIAKLQKARKKAAKMKAKADKKEAKRLAEEEKRLKIKEKLLKKDDYKKILKNSQYFTNEELDYLKERHEQKISDRLDRFMNRAYKISTTVNNIAAMTQGIQSIRKLATDKKIADIDVKYKDLQLKREAERFAQEKKGYERADEEYKQFGMGIAENKARESFYKSTEQMYKSNQARNIAAQQYNKAIQEGYKAKQEGEKFLKDQQETIAKTAQTRLSTINSNWAREQQIRNIIAENRQYYNTPVPSTRPRYTVKGSSVYGLLYGRQYQPKH